MAQIIFAAGDPGPTALLRLVLEGVEDRGHTVSGFFDTDIMASEAVSAIDESDCLVLGMSSTDDRVEFEVALANYAFERNVPVGLVPDMFGVISRQGFEEVGKRAAFACVLNENEQNHQYSVIDPSKSHVTGNPMWDRFFDQPRLSRADLYRLFDIDRRREIIFVAGSKFTIATAGPLMSGLSAVSKIDPEGKRFHVLFGRHPRDQSSVEQYTWEVGQLFRNNPVNFTVLPEDGVKSSDVVPHAALVFTTSSTVGVEAACRRIPVFWPGEDPWQMELLSSVRTAEWLPCDEGAHLRAPYDLDLIRELLKKGSLGWASHAGNARAIVSCA